VKDEFGYLFLFLGNERLQHRQLKENPTHVSMETTWLGSPAPLLSTTASLDRQGELAQLRMKMATSTAPRLSLVFL
jgi:hypothetical protein